jgi:hypothetical protein
MSATIDSLRSDPQQFQAYEPRAPLEDLRPGAFAVGGPGGDEESFFGGGTTSNTSIPVITTALAVTSVEDEASVLRARIRELEAQIQSDMSAGQLEIPPVEEGEEQPFCSATRKRRSAIASLALVLASGYCHCFWCRGRWP